MQKLFVVDVFFYEPMRKVNNRREQYGNTQLYAIAGKAALQVGLGVHFSGGIKGNAQHNKGIEKLGYNRRASAAQPYHALAGFVFHEMEEGNIYKLRNQECGNAAHNNPHTLPENAAKLAIGNQSFAFYGRYAHGHVQQNETIGY